MAAPAEDLAPRLRARVRALLAARHAAEALPMLARLHALPDPDGTATRLEAEALFQLGRLAEAEAMLGRALARAPADPALLMLRGRVRLAAGEAVPATDDFAAAVMAAPGDRVALSLLGRSLLETPHRDEAVYLLGQAFDADPTDPAALAHLGQAFLRTGRHDAAEELLAHGEAAFPNNPEIAALRAQNKLLAGDAAAARALAEAALRHGLAAAPVYSVLAHALVALDLVAEAGPHFTAAARLAPNSAYLAHLAAATAGGAPDRATPDYVSHLFDGYAPRFEDSLMALGYRVPGLVRRAVERWLPQVAAGQARLGPVLDLGCGTGLAGAALWDLLGPRLVGVDLSAGMLAQARAKGIYTELHQDEIGAAMRADATSYGLIVAADVFCYLGPLREILAACRERLALDGLLIFSLEQAQDGAEWELTPEGRYRHGEAAVRAALTAAGLEVVSWQHEALRMNAGAEVPGFFIVARAMGH